MIHRSLAHSQGTRRREWRKWILWAGCHFCWVEVLVRKPSSASLQLREEPGVRYWPACSAEEVKELKGWTKSTSWLRKGYGAFHRIKQKQVLKRSLVLLFLLPRKSCRMEAEKQKSLIVKNSFCLSNATTGLYPQPIFCSRNCFE